MFRFAFVFALLICLGSCDAASPVRVATFNIAMGLDIVL